MKKNVDLLNGPILPRMIKLAVPIMATSFIQMAYNMVDMIWIGRIGSGAVAAVGAAGMYLWLTNGFFVLSKMGGQILVAQSLGAGKKKEAAEYATSAIQLALFYGLILTLTNFIFANPMIRFLGINGAKVIQDGTVYLKIVSIGVLFTFFNQVLTGIFTALGNTAISFRATSVGLVTNIVLDPILIFGIGPFPEMKVAGAAIATVIAQIVVTMMFIIAVNQDRQFFHEVKVFRKPIRKYMNQITKIGLPVAVQSMMFTGISMIISRLVAGFGDDAVAVQKVGSQIESISWMTADGFSAAVNTFIAHNFGANKHSRVKKGYQISLAAVVVWGFFCTALLLIIPGPIFRVFIPEAKILPMGVEYLQILGISQLFMCIEIATQGAFGGVGRTIPPSIVSIVFTVVRIPLAMLLSMTALGLCGIWWSITISSILKGIVLVSWFLYFLHSYGKQKMTICDR